MKKLICLLLAAAVVLCVFSACDEKDKELDITQTGTKAYFLRKDDAGRMYFDYELIELTGETREQRVQEILAAVKNPKSEGAYIAVPEYISLTVVKEKGSTLGIDFSESYKFLKEKEKLIVTVAVCKSILSDGETRYISITCQGEPQAPLYEGYINNHTMLFDDRIYME